MPSHSTHSYEGVSRTFRVEGPTADSSRTGGSSGSSGLWAELRQGLAALGRRAGAGSTWLLRNLHEQGGHGG